MANEIVVISKDVVFQNKTLNKYAKLLQHEALNMRKAMVRISAILAIIDTNKLYEDDGYETIHDFTAKYMGVKRAQSYAILKVGHKLVDEKSFESILKHDKDNDYTMTQLQALLPIGDVVETQKLADSGAISPDMTVAEIKNVVKEYKDKNKPKDDKSKSKSKDDKSKSKSKDDKQEIVEPNYTVETIIQIGHYKDGTPYIKIDDSEFTEVPHKARQIIVEHISKYIK